MLPDSENQSEAPTTATNEPTREHANEVHRQSCDDCTPKPSNSRFDWARQ